MGVARRRGRRLAGQQENSGGWGGGGWGCGGSSLCQPEPCLTPAALCPHLSLPPCCRRLCYRHRKFGTRLREGYREGQGNTRLNTGRRHGPRVREGPSTGKPDWEVMLPLAARETEAQKGTRSIRNGFPILTPCLVLTLAVPSTHASYVSPGVGHCGKYCFQSQAAESSFPGARPGHLHF